MKKYPYLTYLLLLCLLAACLPQATAPGGQSTTITFACWDHEREVYEPLTQKFHAQHPEITVQIVSRGSLGGTMDSSMFTQTARMADTFFDSSIVLDEDTPQNTVLDLTPFADQDETFDVADFYPAALDAFRRQGKLWGIPVYLNVYTIFYRPDVFKENGVAEPEIGWTWQQFSEAALALTQRADGQVTQYGYVDMFAHMALPMLAHQKARPLVNPNAALSQTRIDRPEVAEALQWYADLALGHGVMPDPAAGQPALSKIVYQQKPAMWAAFTLEYSNFKQRRIAIGVVPFPEAGDPATTLTADGAYISAGTAHPEAAWEWINFLSRQPSLSSEYFMPSRQSVESQSKFWRMLDKDAKETYRYALAHAIVTPRPVLRALNRAFEAILAGTPAQQALNEQQPQMLAAIEQDAAAAEQPPVPITVATPFPTPRPGAVAVRFMLPYNADLAAYRVLAQQFQDLNTDIAVELIPADSSGQSPADVADAWAGSFFGDPAKVLPLDAFIETGAVDLANYPPRTLDALRQQGKLLGLPFQVDATLLYYNRDLFAQRGFTVPDADWTPERFVDEAVALTDGAGVYGFYPDGGAYPHAADFVAWLGGTLFDEDGMPTFDDPSVARAVETYVRLLVAGAPATARNDPPASRFANSVTMFSGAHPGAVDKGNIAMWTHSFYLHHTAPPTDFADGIAPFLPGGVLALDSTAHALAISAQAQAPEAAWAWVSFLSAQPEAVTLLPLNRAIAASPAWEQRVGEDTATAWRQILEQDYALWRPEATTTVRYLALHWFDQALAEVLGGAPAAQPLAQAQASAAVFVDCCAGQAETTSAWTACARQADPAIEIPEE
ncbi:MAG TPA: extracellular solute-binding protein [Anaerolineae bacterium]|nr:extracellular solute-binding protein [Anaerolineae bacterium]